ncbi:MAG: arginine decarboxylase, pyruvoyl-dependent [Candidatus Aenigmatarchaeota archaeon]
MVPKYVFFTKGKGEGKDPLSSFEFALRNAGIAPYNLVNVSSILPPNCKVIPKERGIKMLKPGQIVHLVISRMASDENKRLIAAAIGWARPRKKDIYGYISEHHCTGMTEKDAGYYAEDLAVTMLASTLGKEIDIEKAWDKKRGVFKVDNLVISTGNISQSAVCKNGRWTTVIAAAVFVSEE